MPKPGKKKTGVWIIASDNCEYGTWDPYDIFVSQYR